MSLLTFLYILVFAQAPGDGAAAHAAAGKLKEEQGYVDAALAEYKKGLPLPAAWNGVASIEASKGNYDSVLVYLKRSRDLDSTADNLVINYQVEARYWQSKNQYDKSLKFLQLALDKANELGDRRNIAIILGSMASIYFSHEPDMRNARAYIQRAIAKCDSVKDADILARNYARMANTYMVSGDGIQARRYLERAKRITDLSNNLPVRAYVLSSFATLAGGEDRPNEAIGFTQQSMKIKRELGQLRPLQNDLLNVGVTYVNLKMYDKAEASFEEGLSIAKQLKDVVYMKYFYERGSVLDSLKGNYASAYSKLKLAMMYKDSVFSAQRIRDVKEVQEKYEAEQKEKIIAEKELEIEQHKYTQTLLISGALILVLTGMVVLIIVRARDRRKQNQLRLQVIVKTQEDVQQRVARDLHDGLVQILGAAKMSLQSVTPNTESPVIHKQIKNASDIMDEAVTEARSISHQILPYSLLKDGLVSALEDLFARSLTVYDFKYTGEKNTVNELISINTYRIVQELVNNVLKYAPSAKVSAKLNITQSELTLLFEDNGGGYDISKSGGGAGLSNMTVRAELMNGKIVTHSDIGKGTFTELTVPL